MLDELATTIDQVAEKHGWCCGVYSFESKRHWKHSQTGSRYCEFTRDLRDILDPGSGVNEQQITVRISDHPTAYCREDFSVVLGGGSGDDNSLESLVKFLATMPEGQRLSCIDDN